MRIRIEELKRYLAEGASSAYLIEGEDAYLREMAVKTIKNKFLSTADLNLNLYEGAYVRANPAEFVNALSQYPFMSEKRVVILRDYNPTAADLKNKNLDNCLKNLPETAILVIANSSPSENLKKYEGITIVDCGKADMSVIVRYVQITLKGRGLIISTSNARLLAEYCRQEMTKISGETEKLAAYCFGEAEVDEQAIRAIVTKETDYQVYQMTEKIADGKYDEAYSVISEMKAAGNDSQKLFSSLYYHFRRLFHCSIAGKSQAVLARELGVKEFAVKKSVAQAARFSPKRLKSIVDMFEKYDVDIKSGIIGNDAAFSLCVGKIME